MPLESKTPIGDANLFHSDRLPVRRGPGHDKRSAFHMYCFGLASDFEQLGFPKLAAEIRKASAHASDCWSSHNAHDDDLMVRTVEASTQTRLNPLVKDDAAQT